MKHYESLGLTETTHIMATAYPEYVQMANRYEEYMDAEKERKTTKRLYDSVLRNRGAIVAVIEGMVEDDFVILMEASLIMEVSTRTIKEWVKEGRLVGVIWKSRLYILKESMREKGYDIE